MNANHLLPPALRNLRPRRFSQLLCLLTTGLLLHLEVEARNANFRMGFPDVINVPGPNYLAPPIIDGSVSGDLGWTRAFRYVFGTGTVPPNVIMQAIKDSNYIYISFEVANDFSFDLSDVLVLSLDPTGVPADAHRFHIYPVSQGVGAGPGINHLPQILEHWSNSSTWNMGGTTTLPSGYDIKVSSSGVAPNVSWVIEMRLSRAAYQIPATGDFGLYFNVIRVNALGSSGMAIEEPWPTTAPPIDLDLNGNTPAPGDWGTASLSGTANGVSIEPMDIVTGNTPNSKINLRLGLTTFSATVHNNSLDATGTPIAANGVTAHFRIANFGLPGPFAWAAVPTGNNPTPAQAVPASGSATLSTSAWLLTVQEDAHFAANTHQCMLVELDSVAPNTVFANKSAWRNMDFGTASVFERRAEISGQGYRNPPGGGEYHEFDLHIISKAEVFNRKTNAPATAVTSPLSQMTWVAHGYRHTGRYLIIRRQKFEIVDDVGSFGYIVQHNGAVATWNQSLTGQGVKATGPGLYRVQVPINGVATVTTKIEAVEKSTDKGKGRCMTVGKVATVTIVVGICLLGILVHIPRRRGVDVP